MLEERKKFTIDHDHDHVNSKIKVPQKYITVC